MKHIYTSLDIGSDTIKIVVCELYQNKLNLLASSSYRSKGIKKGLIVDVDAAVKSVKGAILQVENMLGIKIKKIFASVPAFNAEYSVIKGSVNINSEEGVVRSTDIINALEIGVKSKEYKSREVVTVLPVDYTLDEKMVVKEPKGMKANSLSSRAILVTTPKKNVYSVIGLLESIGLEVVGISLNNIGDIYAFNNKKIEDEIGAIINIGSDITSISLYNKGVLVKSSVLDQGGKHIDEDIAQKYKIDLTTARHIKVKFALAHKKNSSINDTYEVKTEYEEHLKINQTDVSEVAMNRLNQILEDAKKEINLLTSRKFDYIIITGGTSNMPGFEYVVNDVFGENASIGNIKLLGIRDNMYSSCVGNIIYFISKLKLKGQDYTMINENEFYQMSTLTNKKSTSDSMLGRIFGFFFNE